MLENPIKDNPIIVGSYSRWLVSNSGRKETMYVKIMAAKLKYKADELSSSSNSSSKRINELKISVAYANKSADSAIIKLRFFSKKLRSSDDTVVQGGCTPDEDCILTVKAEDEGTEVVLGNNSFENTVEGTQKGRYIEMGRLKIGGWIG